jgi:hypothetical protein
MHMRRRMVEGVDPDLKPFLANQRGHCSKNTEGLGLDQGAAGVNGEERGLFRWATPSNGAWPLIRIMGRHHRRHADPGLHIRLAASPITYDIVILKRSS